MNAVPAKTTEPKHIKIVICTYEDIITKGLQLGQITSPRGTELGQIISEVSQNYLNGVYNSTLSYVNLAKN